MQKVFILFIALFTCISGSSQSVGIGTNNPNSYAKLEISDTAKGLLIPRMDSTHRKNIPNIKGMMVFDTTTKSFWFNTGTTWNRLAQSGSCNLSIGDTYAGGIIFYLDPSGCHGLVCEPVTDGGGAWATNLTNTALAFGDAIGAGKSNTSLIIAKYGNSNAAGNSTTFSGGGYSDWHLPSKYELKLIYENVKLAGLGGFLNAGYWTSTEIDASHAWIISFSTGEPASAVKNGSFQSRPIRAF